MTVDDRTRDAHAKAAVLAEALPYIREFTGRTVVIKYSLATMALGSTMFTSR